MTRPKRTWPRLVLGLGFSAILVALLIARVDLRESWDAIRNLDRSQIWLPALLLAVGLSIRPWRWQIIFPPAARPKFGSCFGVWSIANMSNNMLPARGGDVLRCVLIARGAKMKTASMALATLGMEKVLDGLALLAVVVLSFQFMTPPGWLQGLTGIAALVFVGATIAMVVLHYKPLAFQRFVLRIAIWLRRPALGRRAAGLLGSFADGFGAVRSLRQMALLTLLTAATWFVEVAFVWAVARALGLPLTLGQGTVVAAILGLGLMVPAAPGYVGSYEFLCVAGLALFGVTTEQAVALGLLMHAGVLLMTTIFGLAALGATGVSFARLAAGKLNDSPQLKEAVVHGQ